MQIEKQEYAAIVDAALSKAREQLKDELANNIVSSIRREVNEQVTAQVREQLKAALATHVAELVTSQKALVIAAFEGACVEFAPLLQEALLGSMKKRIESVYNVDRVVKEIFGGHY